MVVPHPSMPEMSLIYRSLGRLSRSKGRTQVNTSPGGHHMPYKPSSPILFLSICSLNKARGGDPQYREQDSLAFALPPKMGRRLLKRREQVRRLVKQARRLDWQGVPLPDLEFNRGLVQGCDFGGHHAAQYQHAIRRYEGRFFQTLGTDGKCKLYRSKHHMLFLSSLYGLLRPMEPIQLYSCPLKPQITNLWLKSKLLTDILCEYIRQYQITRVFDLTALSAYRNLIDWGRVISIGADVLHCFDTMSAGDYALVPFAQLLKNTLLEAPQDTLMSFEPESRMGSIVFRSVESTQPGLPDELQLLQAAERELPLLQPQPIEYLDEVVRGGHPIVQAETKTSSRRSDSTWLFAITGEFQKDFRQAKSKAYPLVKAIMEICRDPLTVRGNTKIPLTGNKALKGKWRYRLGNNYRLIYKPKKSNHTVYLLRIRPRSASHLYD